MSSSSGIKPSYTLQELAAFVRGKLCDIMPLSPFPMCVLSVYFPSQKKKKKKKKKKKRTVPVWIANYSKLILHQLVGFVAEATLSAMVLEAAHSFMHVSWS